MADIFGTAAGAITGVGMGFLNNYFGQMREEAARRENYKYNEMAAQNADKRTRALYNDFYSPEALKRQYMDAGLSPSLMFGGTPGQGGTAGAQGAGVSQGSTYMPISMLEGAQIANLAAQTEKTKAETENVKADTVIKEIDEKIKEAQEEYQRLFTKNYRKEFIVLNQVYQNGEGETTTESIFNMAKSSSSYEEFVKKVYSHEYEDEEQKEAFTSTTGQKILADIYKISHTMDNEIKAVRVNTERAETEKGKADEELKQAEFQTKVVQALEAAGFPNMNAEATIQVLKTQIAQSELTETQKNAWNRLISKMGDSTMTDIVIVLLSVLQGFSGSISMGFSKKL